MRGFIRLAALFLALLAPALALADTRALLVACYDFVTQPSLGSAASGNLQMIGSALVSAQPRLPGLSVEDGTIGTPDALDAAIERAFSASTEEDLSILYLCTHGVLSSADDGEVYLLLGDGTTETPLSASQLCRMLMRVQGEKLLILDACYSGALIGRGTLPARTILLPGAREGAASPFLTDPSIHVLTSADGREAGWYYDSDRLSTGAVSYFASALSAGLGLYGAPEADTDADGRLTLAELARYLRACVPSSTCQLLSRDPDALELPTASGASLARPLTGFSYGPSLLSAGNETLDFSFTAARETAVQYRLIEYGEGGWDWDGARVFLDSEGALTPGRKTRTLALDGLTERDSGYLMLQIFAVGAADEESLLLCSERLIAVQGEQPGEPLTLTASESFDCPGVDELEICAAAGVPAELTAGVYDAQGALVRRLAVSELTRPSADGVTRLYWDGRDAQGETVPPGDYVITAEAIIGGERQKAACGVRVGL